jgi:hypothetical protein
MVVVDFVPSTWVYSTPMHVASRGLRAKMLLLVLFGLFPKTDSANVSPYNIVLRNNWESNTVDE